MLVLSRKLGETILIGKDVAVTVVRLEGRCVRLGVEAPDHTVVLRKEVKERGDGDGDPSRTKAA